MQLKSKGMVFNTRVINLLLVHMYLLGFPYSRMDKNKTYLLEALCKKGLVMCEMYQSTDNFEESKTILEVIEKYLQ